MDKTIEIRLQDILDAIDGIHETVTGTSFKDFSQSWTMLRAVERGLEIISEASRSIPPTMKGAAPQIPWSQIAGIGNILRHEYQRVEPLIVWNIIYDDLDDLHSAIQKLM